MGPRAAGETLMRTLCVVASSCMLVRMFLCRCARAMISQALYLPAMGSSSSSSLSRTGTMAKTRPLRRTSTAMLLSAAVARKRSRTALRLMQWVPQKQ